MSKRDRWMRAALALLAGASVALSAQGRPVIYTLRTVADGKLGNLAFTQGLITLRLISDTSLVRSQPGPLGGTVFTNRIGIATVTVSTGGRTVTALFRPKEVFVRYDTGNGIAGFGSSISPNYPVALGCDNVPYPSATTYVADCQQGDWGPLNGDTYPAPNGQYSSSINGTLNGMAEATYYNTPGDLNFSLPMDLSHNTLLTAIAHTCATTYTQVADVDQLDVCSGPAPRGLATTLGPLFLQDKDGVSDSQYGNSGSLQVEILGDDE
jgi:hypothetical protein